MKIFCFPTERPISQARLDVDVPLSLCPELGSGHFNAPGIEGHREGLDWAPVFKTVRYDAQDQEVSFLLEDKVALLEIKVEIKLDFESDVVQKRVTVTNKGSNKYYLNKLSSTLPLPNHANELMTFHGRWCHEFQTQRQRFEHGGFMQENRRGRTSHMKTSLACLQVLKGSQSNMVWYGDFIWAGVVTTKCARMFVVMVAALFRLESCY